MTRLWCVMVLSLAASCGADAYAGEGGAASEEGLPPAEDTQSDRDYDADLPPWQRRDAIDPQIGVDDDPTPFDPAATPQAPGP